MTAVNVIPPQVPFTTPDGRIAREWFLFIVGMFDGGTSNSSSITAIQSLLTDVYDLLNQQRSERSGVVALAQRVADLEEQLQNLRPPIADMRIPDLQTFTFGSRPWL